ncbi:MAG TPA: alpha/beta fold hydrolase [Candidatus Bathyarchaeia archaeon]|nr:alpha/beta fold hydrolase [Candidatus Bathyarchaeia archaeon]
MNKKASEIVKSDKFVDIGTHKLRVILSDIESDYTIVLESGGGMSSEAYQEIQDTLAAQTKIRVMSYDRSGFGQSELGPDKFTALDEVKTLKKCLKILGFKNKFILVGHSYGGLLVQLFTLQYPELVNGLVLIDPMNVKFVDRFGLDNLNAVTPYFENPTKNDEKAGNRMVDCFPIALETMRGKELPIEVPIKLITAGNPPLSNNIWSECHQEIVKNSEKHELLIAKGNSHMIVAENPKLVLTTIIELVNEIKSEKI